MPLDTILIYDIGDGKNALHNYARRLADLCQQPIGMLRKLLVRFRRIAENSVVEQRGPKTSPRTTCEFSQF
jgi:hypothetical protein